MGSTATGPPVLSTYWVQRRGSPTFGLHGEVRKAGVTPVFKEGKGVGEGWGDWRWNQSA